MAHRPYDPTRASSLPAMDAMGTPEPLPLQPVLLLSPHLDDGVFACGRLLAPARDAIVAT